MIDCTELELGSKDEGCFSDGVTKKEMAEQTIVQEHLIRGLTVQTRCYNQKPRDTRFQK